MTRNATIAAIAFLTLVDLFATQAILPTLARAYGVAPAAMGVAVNASAFGMAIAGLAVALFGRRVDRRAGVAASLALLAIPTALLGAAPDLATFAFLRVCQGLAMASAFALTLSYLAERCSAADAAGAFAAYITGNVASNLFGRLMSAALADHLGIAGNFATFAGMNLAGAAIAWFALGGSTPAAIAVRCAAPWRTLVGHWKRPALAAAFALGFLTLFAFIGVYTYVNFELVQRPLALTPMQLGIVYLVFAPSLVTTPLAGRAVARHGARRTFRASIAVALVGLPLIAAPHLAAVVAGLACVGIGTFFAQATATGFVGRTATDDPGSASGMYLASYFTGGLAGAAIVGQVYQSFGWNAAVLTVGIALALAAALARALGSPASPSGDAAPGPSPMRRLPPTPGDAPAPPYASYAPRPWSSR
ncbi:MAG: MFS transporter [Burkholderiales bacterium]|nr:MFS transporter [Burkholderiales bacterium]